MIDLFIRKNSNHKNSLDDVMRSLYDDFALKHHGYTEHDVKTLIEYFATQPADEIFNRYINGTESYENYLQGLLHEVGCYISKAKSPLIYEEQLGFKTIAEGQTLKVNAVAPDSPAAKAGLSKEDELICVNDFKVENNLDDLLRFATGKEIKLEVFTQKKKRLLNIQASDTTFYNRHQVELIKDATIEQQKYFTQWTGIVMRN